MSEQAHYNVRGSAPYSRSLGITQHATPLDLTWTGELRVRFSDFLVNEIGENNSVIRLSQIGFGQKQNSQPADEAKPGKKVDPEAPKSNEQQVKPEAAETAPAPPVQTVDVSAEDAAALEALTGAQFAKGVIEMYKAGSTDHDPKKSITSGPVEDRPKRGEIHQQIRRIFNSRIETSTNDEGAIIATMLPPRKGKAKKRGRTNRDNHDDKPQGEYLHFTLHKENRDTMDAVSQVSRFLRIKPQAIGYAGTKDRRAATTQRCSMRHMRASNLNGLNDRVWGVYTGDYEYSDRGIHLGQLLGNEFVITIKGCQVIGDVNQLPLEEKMAKLQTNVTSALNHMASHGWINYFGHQRFGTHKIGTHEIGKYILGGNYEKAVNALLYYDEDMAAKAEKNEIPEEPLKRDEFLRAQACMLFLTEKDPDKASSIMPRRFTAETCVLRQLNRGGVPTRKDFIGGLVHITRGLRSMYLHAYQSYVWNHVASKRWELHGEKVIKGDLVISQNEATPLVSGQDQDGDDIINPVADDDDEETVRARPLTEEEANSGKFAVYDVVLPTPGYDVVYPDNDIVTYYTEFMGREENGSLDPLKMRRMKREFSLPGRYRKLMNQFLGTPSAEVKAYTHDTEQMHPTDLDLIKQASTTSAKRGRDEAEDELANKKTKTETTPQADATATGESEEKLQQESSDKMDEDKTAETPSQRIAVVVKFQLGRSAYATVALRELMGDPPEETS